MMVRPLLRLSAGCLLLFAAAARGGRNLDAAPRQVNVLFDALHSATGTSDLAILPGSWRVLVLFTPELSRCQPLQVSAARALARFASDHPEAEVATLIPPGAEGMRSLYGEPFPGRTVVVPRSEYVREERLVPTPRIEVWDHDERALLVRSLPAVATEREIYDELLWSLAFTKPEVP